MRNLYCIKNEECFPVPTLQPFPTSFFTKTLKLLHRQNSLPCENIWIGKWLKLLNKDKYSRTFIDIKGGITVVNGVLQVRRLDVQDHEAVRNMETGIEDDYVVRIFPDLISRRNNVVYGLFDGDQIIAVAGYTTFYDQYAMLGRLRSDRRYHGKGHATYLLQQIINEVHQHPNIKWIGANTQISNSPARKVLEKLSIPQMTLFYPAKVTHPHLLEGTDGPLWDKITDRDKKRELVQSLSIDVFPYEAYYPLPFDEIYITDDYLDSSACYVNPNGDRFMFIREDQKKYLYANVKYFWNDAFKQPGFWKTVLHETEQHPEIDGVWLDLTPEAYAQIPDTEVIEVGEPWILHGLFVEK